MWTKVGVGLYCVAALWLAAFVAYLVYLLLPFGVGLLSSSLAALVAVLLLISLIRRLIVAPLKGEPLGRWRSILVSAVALATLTLDAGWTHYLVPFPPTDQDDCTFGPIGPGEFRALRREMAAMPAIDWEEALEAERRSDGVAMALRERLEQVLSSRPSSDEKIAAMHALMRSIGAELSYAQRSTDAAVATYRYRLDLNRIGMRRLLVRWAQIVIRFEKPPGLGGRPALERVVALMPDMLDPGWPGWKKPPQEKICPPPPTGAPTFQERLRRAQ